MLSKATEDGTGISLEDVFTGYTFIAYRRCILAEVTAGLSVGLLRAFNPTRVRRYVRTP